MESDLEQTNKFFTLEEKGDAFLSGISERTNLSMEFIKKEFDLSNRFMVICDFVSFELQDSVKSLGKVGNIPTIETQMELDHAVKHALIGSYKSAFADLRRALELILLSVYYSSKQSKEAESWLRSESNTPFFSTMIKQVLKEWRYNDFNSKFEWEKDLKKLYHGLSDFSHNKGRLKSYDGLNQTTGSGVTTSYPKIYLPTLAEFCNFYISTVEQIVVMLALYNPKILLGLPLEEKFGLNPPASGFFSHTQAEDVHDIIPDKYKEYFMDLSLNDSELKSISDWVHSLPDLTEEDIKNQITQFNEMMSQFPSYNKPTAT